MFKYRILAIVTQGFRCFFIASIAVTQLGCASDAQGCKSFPRGIEIHKLNMNNLVKLQTQMADKAVLAKINICQPSIKYGKFEEALSLYKLLRDDNGTYYYIYTLQYTTDVGRVFEVPLASHQIKESYFSSLS